MPHQESTEPTDTPGTGRPLCLPSTPDAPPSLIAPPEVIVYGTVCLDRFQSVDADGVPLVSEPEDFPGGEAFNTATLLAGWGVSVALTGTAIGNDPEGLRLQHLLKTHPLAMPHDFVPQIPHAITPSCLISVYPDGERRMQGRGFAQAIPPPPLPEEILRTRPIYTMDPNLGEVAIAACEYAAAWGCPIIGMDVAHLPRLVSLCRIVVTSEDAFVRFFGEAGRLLTPETLAKQLLEQGTETAIITRGKDGCVVMDRAEGLISVPAASLPGIIDTTGAGDAFRAGLCYGMLKNLTLRDTLRFAAATAALHCQVRGGGSRIPLDAVRLLAQ